MKHTPATTCLMHWDFSNYRYRFLLAATIGTDFCQLLNRIEGTKGKSRPLHGQMSHILWTDFRKKGVERIVEEEKHQPTVTEIPGQSISIGF